MGGSTPRLTKPRGIKSQKDQCQLVIHTQLKSPNEDIVITINSGDVLDIVIIPPGECVALKNGEVAGKIFCLELQDLLSCIKAGNNYIARVRSVHGIRCAITISQL